MKFNFSHQTFKICFFTIFLFASSFLSASDLENLDLLADNQKTETENQNSNGSKLNLAQTIRLVFEKSELIQIAKENQKQTSLKAQTLNSTFLPNISGALNTNKSKSTSQQTVSTNSATLELSQKIWQPLSSDNSDAKAEITQNLANFVYQKTESDLILQAATQFLNVLKSRYQIDYAQTARKGAQYTLEIAQILFDTGQTSKLELLRSISSLDSAKAAELSAKQNYSILLTTLGNLVGQDIDAISEDGINILENLANNFTEESDNLWLNQIGANNSELKIAFYNEKLASLDAKSAENKNAPELQLRASTTQFLNNDNGLKNSSSVGLTLAVPIYQAGNLERKLETNQSILRQSQLNYDLLKKELRYNLTDLKQRQQYINQLIVAYENAQKSAKSQLDSTNEAYRSGVSEVNDVNSATTSYAKAELDTKLVKIDKIINYIALNHLLGLLSEQKVTNLF